MCTWFMCEAKARSHTHADTLRAINKDTSCSHSGFSYLSLAAAPSRFLSPYTSSPEGTEILKCSRELSDLRPCFALRITSRQHDGTMEWHPPRPFTAQNRTPRFPPQDPDPGWEAMYVGRWPYIKCRDIFVRWEVGNTPASAHSKVNSNSTGNLPAVSSFVMGLCTRDTYICFYRQRTSLPESDSVTIWRMM